MNRDWNVPIISIIVLLSACLLFAGRQGYTAQSTKPTVLEGIIEHVTDSSIEVRGRYYGISEVPLRDASGRMISKSRLIVGTKVEIFFENDRITSILVHQHMAE